MTVCDTTMQPDGDFHSSSLNTHLIHLHSRRSVSFFNERLFFLGLARLSQREGDGTQEENCLLAELHYQGIRIIQGHESYGRISKALIALNKQ